MLRLIALIVPLTLSLCAPAHADERFMPYIDWLTENSSFEYNGEELPTIRQMPYAYLEVEVYGPENVAMAERQGTELPKIHGAYRDDTNEMLYADDVDPWAWENRDTLVHELVHFLQMVNGINDECVQKLERPAYKLHWEWVEAHGYQDQFEEPNWLWVYVLEMACHEDPWQRHDAR